MATPALLAEARLRLFSGKPFSFSTKPDPPSQLRHASHEHCWLAGTVEAEVQINGFQFPQMKRLPRHSSPFAQ